MSAAAATVRHSNPLLCVDTFDARVSHARAMLRNGKTEREVREKHGGCVLMEAMKGLPLSVLTRGMRKR